MDRVYFWLSGHFPSRKFPQTYKVVDGKYDTTEKSRIGSIEDQRRIIRSAHERGLKIYLGGALGAWAGTRFLTNLEADTLKTQHGAIGESSESLAAYSLCPSNARVRRALIDYYREMFDTLPEADGLYTESADEMGECQCAQCNRPVDQFGSRQFGQAQLTLVQQIMKSIWSDHPHVCLAYTIGYAPHKSDPAYYEVIRQMTDPLLRNRQTGPRRH